MLTADDWFRQLGQGQADKCIGDGPRVRRQPPRRSDRQARAGPGSARRADRDASKGAANPLYAETAATPLEGRRETLRARLAAPRHTGPGVVV